MATSVPPSPGRASYIPPARPVLPVLVAWVLQPVLQVPVLLALLQRVLQPLLLPHVGVGAAAAPLLLMVEPPR